MDADNIDPALQERLLPAEEGGDDRDDAPEANQPGSYYAIASQACCDVWKNHHTQKILNTFRRFLVGGTKVSGTVAFAMYLNLIYERVSLARQIGFKVLNSEINAVLQKQTLLHTRAAGALASPGAQLACVAGEFAIASNLTDIISMSSSLSSPIPDDSVNASLISELTNLSLSAIRPFYAENHGEYGIEAIVPAACIDVAAQDLDAQNVSSLLMSICAGRLAQTLMCNQTGPVNYFYYYVCYDCFGSLRLANRSVMECFNAVPQGIQALLSSQRPKFYAIQSELVRQVLGNASLANSEAERRMAAVATARSLIEENFDQLSEFFQLQDQPLPFSSLPPAYHHMGRLLMGIFFGFGVLDAVLSLFPMFDKHVRPYYYGLLAGIGAAMIKVALLLSLFGHCHYPYRPTYDEFERGEKITFLNIPVCKADIAAITLWSLTWLIPLSALTAYFEFNKFNLDITFPKLQGFYVIKLIGFLENRQQLLSTLGLAFSSFMGFLAFTDLLFEHLIPYGSAVKGTPGAELSERDDTIIKLSLAVPVMVAGSLVERRYLRDKAHSLSLRKSVAALSEWCEMMLFNYVALSFFVAFEYADGLHAGHDNPDGHISSPMDISPWHVYWMLLCLSVVGGAIVVHDEWYYKMVRPEKTDNEDEIETFELEELVDEDNAPAEADDNAEPAESATSIYYCSSAMRWLSSWFQKPAAEQTENDENVRHVRFASTVATTAC